MQFEPAWNHQSAWPAMAAPFLERPMPAASLPAAPCPSPVVFVSIVVNVHDIHVHTTDPNPNRAATIGNVILGGIQRLIG
jgi:hypothetical protein